MPTGALIPPPPNPANKDRGQSAACTALGGRCGSGACGGTVVHNKCPGSTDWVCCVPKKAPAPAPKKGPAPAPAPGAKPRSAVGFPAGAGASQHGVTGIDVSGFQHPNGAKIDWHKVKQAGHSFVIIKATEGTGFVNSFFHSDWTEAAAAGLLRGAYHFARPSQPIVSTAQAQARHLAQTIGNLQADNTLPAVLDLEETGGLSPSAVGQWAVAFLEEVEKLTGRTPILYTGYFFLTDNAGSPPTGRFPLWEAWYTTASAPPKVPAAYHGKWTFWQHSSTGRVPGIIGNVDMNRFCCSLDELKAFAAGNAQSPAHQPAAPAHPPAAPHPGAPVPQGTTKCTTTEVHVRSAPGLSGAVVATSKSGQAWIVSDKATVANGYTWHHVTKCGGGVSGFMAIRPDWQTNCHCAAAPAAPVAGHGRTAPQPPPPKPAAPKPPPPPPPSPVGDVQKWKDVIRAMTPKAAGWIVDGVAAAMPQMVTKFALTTENRQAYFLAQTAMESAGYITTTEFASGAEYNGRRDLGNTHPGDGPRFKGRGIIQLTGRSNYGTYGKILGVDLVGNPELAAKFPWAALTAGQYWKSRNINECADRNDFVCATKRINGGTNGLSTRQLYLGRARAALHGRPIGVGARAAVQGTTATDFPMWAIGAIVGGVVALVAAAVIIALVVRHRRAAAGADGQEKLLDISEQQALSRHSVTTEEFSAVTQSGTVPRLRK